MLIVETKNLEDLDLPQKNKMSLTVIQKSQVFCCFTKAAFHFFICN